MGSEGHLAGPAPLPELAEHANGVDVDRTVNASGLGGPGWHSQADFQRITLPISMPPGVTKALVSGTTFGPRGGVVRSAGGHAGTSWRPATAPGRSDGPAKEVDTCDMEEGFERRLYFPDVRGGGRYLRVTWHSDTSTIVLSHWRDDVSAASTPISLPDATRLIGLIVGALQESADLRPNVPGAGAAATARGSLLSRFRARFQARLGADRQAAGRGSTVRAAKPGRPPVAARRSSRWREPHRAGQVISSREPGGDRGGGVSTWTGRVPQEPPGRARTQVGPYIWPRRAVAAVQAAPG